jgi:hypothetical protein
MMKELAAGCRVLPDGRDVDTALGVLIGLRRYRREDAFDELLRAADRHQISPFTGASALVKLVSGDDLPSENTAVGPAHREWSDLFGHQPSTANRCEWRPAQTFAHHAGARTVTAIAQHSGRTELVHPH